MSDELGAGRTAYAGQGWAEAYTRLAAAEPVDATDLERLAVAAHLVGRDADSARGWERAVAAHTRAGDPERAARCAFWLGFGLLLRGESARAGGWLARGERLLDEVGQHGPAGALLRVPRFLERLGSGDPAGASALAGEIADAGRRSGDPDVLALGLLSLGEAAVALGETAAGLRLLDEAMVGVTAGEVSPIPTGIVYCAVIEQCVAAFDLRRAAEWTEALRAWCAAQPDLVPFRGQCLVHRSEILQARGAWPEAVLEAERARDLLASQAHPALGLAHYQRAELHRVRGELADAERAYRSASRHGREPAPGFALLRLSEGNVAGAVAAVHRMLAESIGPVARPSVLAAAVEILLAAGDADGARAARDELVGLAEASGAVLLRAVADFASGRVLLADGDARSALGALRGALDGWRTLDMPYDVARAREQLAVACGRLGDHEAAGLELDAALATYTGLGAAADVARVSHKAGAPGRPAALTDRECEVLRLVAAGRSNREIAEALVISTHTVARHVQNIFAKTGLTSRAAATAFAYRHDLA